MNLLNNPQQRYGMSYVLIASSPGDGTVHESPGGGAVLEEDIGKGNDAETVHQPHTSLCQGINSGIATGTSGPTAGRPDVVQRDAVALGPTDELRLPPQMPFRQGPMQPRRTEVQRLRERPPLVLPHVLVWSLPYPRRCTAVRTNSYQVAVLMMST